MSASEHEDRIIYLPCVAPEQTLRFHLDENVARAVAVALRGHGFDVTTTHDVGLRSKSDHTQMAYAHEEQRVLVTRDKDFLQLSREEHPHSGIVYWPHGRATKSAAMQALLIELLQQIVASPGEAAEISPQLSRAHGAARHQHGAAVVGGRGAAPSRNLPAGYLVRATVHAQDDQQTLVVLETGQRATLLAHRRPPVPLSIGDDIEAVTVLYVRSRNTLHLSMRRNFALARTMPRVGLRSLRRNNHRWRRQLEQQRPVEIVIEEPHTVRVFGADAEAVRATAGELDHHVPWTASAAIAFRMPALKAWVTSAFGSFARFAHSTGVALHWRHDGRVVICAATNRELDHVLNLVRLHVPETALCSLQSARTEALHTCAWPPLDETRS
jgi:predicted nuclease of predicted toxin-antitoxin system